LWDGALLLIVSPGVSWHAFKRINIRLHFVMELVVELIFSIHLGGLGVACLRRRVDRPFVNLISQAEIEGNFSLFLLRWDRCYWNLIRL
jgi:hypothetical protein